MLFFKGFSGPKFIWAVLEAVGLWLGIVTGLDWLWPKLDITTPELIWAVTVTTGLFVFYIGMLLCYGRQQVLMDRINECAKAKSDLEEALLKKRQSSKKKGRTA